MDLESIGVVIPAFNAGKTIGNVIAEIISQGFKSENIIVVDDGSSDETGDVVRSYGVAYIKHKSNIGKGRALKSGFCFARNRYLEKVLTIDADGQHKSSEIGSFLRLKDQYDIIVGYRHDMDDMPILRRLVNRITSLVISLLSGRHLLDVQCGFRLIDLDIFSRLDLLTNNYQTESEMMVRAARLQYRIGSIPITTVYNKEKSHISPIIDTIRFVKMAVGFLWR